MAYKIIKGKKYSKRLGSIKNVWYIASKMTDGFCYFNDDERYRCNPDGSNLQVYYPNQNRWIRTSNIIIDGAPSEIDPVANQTQLNTNTATTKALKNGMGVVAGIVAVQDAILWCKQKAASGKTYYSNEVRWGPYGYDCSSFLISAWRQAGFPLTGATYTGNMKSVFTREGFNWHPSSSGVLKANQLLAGDILLCETRYGGHTQMYIGNNQDVNCGGSCAEVQAHANDNYGRGWDGFLRLAEMEQFAE